MKPVYIRAIEAATECSLAVVWCTAAAFSFLLPGGPHFRDRLFANLFWALLNSNKFVLLGTGLFFAAWGLSRLSMPSFVILVIAGVAAPLTAFLIARRSFFDLLNQPGYYYLGPMIFLAEFIGFAFFYGAVLLPRNLKPQAVSHLHIHWAVLALMVPYAQVLVLHTILGVPQQVFGTSSSTPKPTFEIVYARWTPGHDALTVQLFDMHLPPPRGGLIPEPERGSGYVSLNTDEIKEMSSSDIGGRVVVLGGITASNHVGRLVLIMSQPLDSIFEFQGPGNADVIYLQTSEGWRKIPPDAPDSKPEFVSTHLKIKPMSLVLRSTGATGISTTMKRDSSGNSDSHNRKVIVHHCLASRR